MSKFIIEVLKAPFPEGAKVGDVIEFAQLPTWALGKVKQTDDAAEVTVSFESAEVAPAELQDAAEVPDGVEVATPRRGRPPKAAE